MNRLHRTPATDAAFSQVVDGATGIVQDMRESAVPAGCPALFVYGTTTADTTPIFGRRANIQNSGAAPTRRGARVSSVGEAIERYCTACWDKDDITVASYSELQTRGIDAIHPSAYQTVPPGTPSPHGRKYAAFTPDTQLGWARVWSLTRGCPIMVPATAVFLPYRPIQRNEHEVYGTYSTGVAAAATVAEATYFGLCESIERDAFMNAWLNRLILPTVDHLADPRWAAEFAEIYDRPGLQYHVLDATTDIGVPVALCVMVDHAESPLLYSVSAACHLSMGEAVRKAVLEAAHGYLWVRSLRSQSAAPEGGAAGIHNFEDHVAFHASGQALDQTRWLWEGQRPLRALDHHPWPDAVHSFEDAVTYIVERLEACGVEATAAEMTTEDVGELGIRVVRTFAPQLIPLHAGMDTLPSLSPRLYVLPERMGLGPNPSSRADLTASPHPFP